MLKRERKKKQRERKRKRLRKAVKGNHERKSEVNGSERSLDGGGGFSGRYVSVASRSRVFFSRPRVVLCLLTVCARESAKVVPLLINCVIFLQLLSRARVSFRRGLSSSSTPSSFLFLFLSGTSLAMGFNIFRGRRELPFYIYPSAFMLRRRKRRDVAYYLRGSITLRV